MPNLLNNFANSYLTLSSKSLISLYRKPVISVITITSLWACVIEVYTSGNTNSLLFLYFLLKYSML